MNLKKKKIALYVPYTYLYVRITYYYYPELFAAVPSKILSHASRNLFQFYIPTYKTSYGPNHTLHYDNICSEL